MAIEPRLLTDAEAAAYLSIPTTSLRRLNVGRVVLDGRVRWDRLAIDAWLDAENGLVTMPPAPSPESEADAALARARARLGL